jgi:PAS domain S-box-containing protein
MNPALFDSASLLPDLGEDGLRRILGEFFAASFNGILITAPTPGYPILYANPAFCRMTGYTLEELQGRSPALLQGERTSAQVVEKMNAALKAGWPFHGAAINYRKDGESYPVEWNISPVCDEQGQVRYFISVQKDLTELRQVLSRFKHSSEHFRAFLRDLTPALGLTPQKRQLATELIDNLRQCDASRFVEDDTVLFDADDLFDLGGAPAGAPDVPAIAISALDYARHTHFGDSEIAEILGSIEETREQLDLLDVSSDKSRELSIIADNLQELANAIFYLDDFVALSTVLAELATRTRISAQVAVPPFVADIFRGLLQDVETWVNTVFVSRTARDIHELDNSIMSSARQLLMFLPQSPAP